MNHYCTYFDRGFLIQGLALWRSLARHDPAAVLWVLALDDATSVVLRRLGDARLRVVTLAELERDDPPLAAAKANRTRVEYFFTLSPCWPRWLLAHQPEIDRITYLDADLCFFAPPAPVFSAMDAAGASVLITPHRFSPWLSHYEQHGRFNVGILVFRGDATGRACLDDWRERCLAWCHDRVEDGRYADQGYLDAWPERWGQALLVLDHPGVNLAPWNWMQHRLQAAAVPPGQDSPPSEPGSAGLTVDGCPVIVFHFARFRPLDAAARWWQSGQLDYGIMPPRWREALYSPYLRALRAARTELRALDPAIDFPRRAGRLGRDFWRALPLRLLFGGDWLRAGDRFFNLRFGLGRWSGRALAIARKAFRRRIAPVA
ncbi:hypothetical protein [Opitutus sp. ER46]|uniref:hypothetical protein n=1 Tax=Opitutus sp. ER46 TaxID=2161864 RepID=UPI0011B27961|nr:hypothetical protein [Opitutus sp. ER46]